ncbi:hypothetical protein [Tropicimonas aquimaris]|uniref:Uncharacterized protein n=1 Tax=Tropicimonas aquimaris TaxID=914152 RepID=A0ABW3IX99_9RHOB
MFERVSEDRTFKTDSADFVSADISDTLWAEAHYHEGSCRIWTASERHRLIWRNDNLCFPADHHLTIIWEESVPLHRFLAAVFVAFVSPGGTLADPVPCPDPMLRVDAPGQAVLERVCHAASAARDAASVCALAQIEPIEILLVDTPAHPVKRCLAICEGNRIEIVRPELLIEKLQSDDPYAVLSGAIVFNSLLRHEMAHALLQQALKERDVQLVDHEFVAAALEFAGMPLQYRERLLDETSADWEATRDNINIFVYSFAPREFAATSWRYFEENGCMPIEGIIQGTFSFGSGHR